MNRALLVKHHIGFLSDDAHHLSHNLVFEWERCQNNFSALELSSLKRYLVAQAMKSKTIDTISGS